MTRDQLREAVAREIMEQFWGKLIDGQDWELEARQLTVDVSDSMEGRETVIELTDKIVNKIAPK